MNPRKKHKNLSIFNLFDIYPREYFVFAFFFIFFFAIIWETFSYTVVNYDFYSNLAERQQVWEVEVPVTRWTVFLAANSGVKNPAVLSTSVDLNDIAVDPQIEWDKEKLRIFLTDLLYKEMCYLKPYEDCYNAMLRFLRVLEIGDFENTEEYIVNRIDTKLAQRLAKNKITSVKLLWDISPDEEKELLSWNIAWIYPWENGLYVNPEEIIQKELFAQKYSEYFWWGIENILYLIRSRDLRYISIFQKLSLSWSDRVESYLDDERQALKQGIITKADTIGGFIIMTPHAQRIYPEKVTASQIVGFTDNSGSGRYWLEWYFDDILRGNPGEKARKKDIQGRTIDPISLGKTDIWAREWVDIQTTIDRNIQRKIEKLLENGVKKYRATSGTVVVMEPKTGKIISLANYPSYDPNNPWEVYTLERVSPEKYPNPSYDLLGKTVYVEDVERGEKFIYDGREIYLREAKREEYGNPALKRYTYKNGVGAWVYQNSAISSIYEPGSIMKALTVAIGIDTGEIQPYSMYQDNGKVTIDQFTISNVSSACLGYNSFTHALSFSCNVGMIRIVQRLGKALFYKYLVDFWFNEPTGITLEGEVSTRIDPYEIWPISKLLTSSYGLWVSVTPIQMAAAYSVLANGGVYMRPYIVDTVRSADGNEVSYEPQYVRRVLKESTSEAITKMLVSWVDTGVANNGAVEWYSIAGKTWTSQIAYRGGYENGPGSTYASFAWYAPAEDPQFVVIVKLDRPKTTQFWWESSAFIFSEITQELLSYYQIPKKEVGK